MLSSPEISYDSETDVVIIDGLKFAREVFAFMASEPTPGRWYRLIKREQGVVTIETRKD